MKRSRIAQLVLMVSLVFAGSLHAQFIHWGPVQTCGPDSDVVTNGTLVCAYAVNTNTTVNGVSFEKAPVGNTGVTNWGDKLVLNFGVTGTRSFDVLRSTPDVSVEYAPLLKGLIMCSFNGDPNVSSATVTLTNLTVGTQYLVQLWIKDDGNNKSSSYRVTGYDGYGAREFGGVVGQFTTLIFTAITNTLTLTGFGLRAMLSAIQVRALSTAPQIRLWSGGKTNVWNTSSQNWQGYGSGDTLWDTPNGVTNHAAMGAAEQVQVPSGVNVLGIDAGGMIFKGNGSLTLNGKSFYVGSLVDMNVPLSAPQGLEKRSAGVLSLPHAGNSVTNVSVLEGSLALGGVDYSKLPGLAYHLDASLTNTLTLSGTSVSAWMDADGKSLSFSAPDAVRRPTYVSTAFGGRGALRFGETVSNLLVSTSLVRVQTVVIVSKPMAARAYMGIWGPYLGNGIRITSTTAAWQYTVGTHNVFTDNNAASGGIGQMFVNGVQATSANAAFTSGQPQVLTAISEGALSSTNSIGYWEAVATSRYFNGEVAEIYAFNRALTSGERLSLEASLSNKWINVAQPVVVQNVLSSDADVDVAASAQLVLSDAQQQLRSLTGKGIVSGTVRRDSVVTISNQVDSTFEGTLTGALSLRKTGAGTLVLANYHTYTGITEIQGGTLSMKILVPTNGLTVHLDAAVGGTLTLGTGSNVVSWTSKRGDGLSFTQADAALQPVYVASAFNGRGGVRFGATLTNTVLKATASRVAQTAFFVLSTVSANRDYAGVWGRDSLNTGFRTGGSGVWQYGISSSFWTGSSGTLRIDGVESINPSIPLNQTQIIGLTRAASVNWTTALGCYYTASPIRLYDGVMGEVMIYDRALSAEEIASVENYLTGKWKATGRLPVSTAVTVSNGAFLDLGDSAQTLQSLAGGGSVTNGLLHVTDVIVPEGALTLPGGVFVGTVRITPDDSLILTGDSNIQGMTLEIQNPQSFAYGQVYTVVACTGVLGEALPTLTGGGSYRWILRKVGNTIQIGRSGGTMISIL